MKLATTFACIAAVLPLAVRAESFWVGVATCEVGSCDGYQCDTDWQIYEFLSEEEPGCGDFYNAQTDDNWDWASGDRPYKFTEILCGSTIDFYNSGSGYNFYYSGGDGTQLGSCSYDTGSSNGPCPFGTGSCAVQGVMYCNSNVQIC